LSHWRLLVVQAYSREVIDGEAVLVAAGSRRLAILI
jgi:hypothetical protein